jgi:hypothetical protein
MNSHEYDSGKSVVKAFGMMMVGERYAAAGAMLLSSRAKGGKCRCSAMKDKLRRRNSIDVL